MRGEVFALTGNHWIAPIDGATGLYHVTILTRPGGRWLTPCGASWKRASRPTGPAIKGVSEALYLIDPDGNGIELYWDRPKDVWPRTPHGELAIFNRRLDLNGLLAEAGANPEAPSVGEGPQDL